MCKNTMGKCFFHRAGGPTSIDCNQFAPSLDQLAFGDLETALVEFARRTQRDCDGPEAHSVAQDLLDMLEESGVDINPVTEE